MSTVSVGQRAEQVATEYLCGLGFELLEQNYRRPHCEIDIVVRKDGVVYFVEVKYRASDHFGGGLEYITSQKMHHMQRAAMTWMASNDWNGEYQLSAVEVSSWDFIVTDFIEDIFI